jgi:protein-tyrosine kinase
MGKTHIALMKAEKENAEKLLQIVTAPSQDNVPALWDPLGGSHKLIPEWFKELKTRLELNADGREIRKLMFTSTMIKNGCSSVAAGFAKCLAADFGKRVLLVDANIRNPSLHNFFGNEYIQDIEEILSENTADFSQSQEKWSRNLHVFTCGNQDEDMSPFFSSDSFRLVMDSASRVFDYILVDSPPVALCSETRIICSAVDGVILVLEAGKTRRQAALRAKREIESAGGVFLGSILNKRKFYIPNWLYRRL